MAQSPSGCARLEGRHVGVRWPRVKKTEETHGRTWRSRRVFDFFPILVIHGQSAVRLVDNYLVDLSPVDFPDFPAVCKTRTADAGCLYTTQNARGNATHTQRRTVVQSGELKVRSFNFIGHRILMTYAFGHFAPVELIVTTLDSRPDHIPLRILGIAVPEELDTVLIVDLLHLREAILEISSQLFLVSHRPLVRLRPL